MAGRSGAWSEGRLAAIVVAAALSHAVAGGAHAQPRPVEPGDDALAQALFDDGQRLMDEGRYAEACPRLAESQRIDPAGGTLLNLAVCREFEGRTATAWVTFKEAVEVARREGRGDRQALAEQHLAALEPRLSRLRVDVPEAARIAGLTVAVDGIALGAGAWGVATPIDPGEHRVVASAPGRRPWETRIGVAADGASAVVTLGVPERIEARTSAPPKPAAARPAASSRDVRRPVGLALLGVGVVGLGAGTVAGLFAIGKENEARERGCIGATCPDATALDASNAANDAAIAATVFLPVGVAAAAAGVVLLVLARPAPPRAVSPTARGLAIAF